MRKKGCYHKNRPFRLLVAAALRFVQSYLNDIGYSIRIICLPYNDHLFQYGGSNLFVNFP